jgi:lipopolysaccharide transport system ATP-binding protein
MAETIIEVEGLSKLFSLGAVGTGSFRQDLKRWWTSSILKKADPFFLETGPEDKSHIWALQNVSFDVKGGKFLELSEVTVLESPPF